MKNQFKIGDIVAYDDTLFDDDNPTYVSDYFFVTNIDDKMIYLNNFNNDQNDNPIESYHVGWIEDSPSWRKLSE